MEKDPRKRHNYYMKTRVDFGNEMDRYRNVKPQEYRKKGRQQTLKDNAENSREELAATKNRSHKNVDKTTYSSIP